MHQPVVNKDSARFVGAGEVNPSPLSVVNPHLDLNVQNTDNSNTIL